MRVGFESDGLHQFGEAREAIEGALHEGYLEEGQREQLDVDQDTDTPCGHFNHFAVGSLVKLQLLDPIEGLVGPD